MLDPVDIDVALLCKKIHDYNRCAVCDKGVGSQFRYPCGHNACSDCAGTQDCVICLTNSRSTGPVIDEILTERVKNAGNLLSAYQSLFPVDVHEKQRLSEKLKIEKQVFPECIQAPHKYYNKRKSLNNSFKGKENQFHFLGEEISYIGESKMDTKRNLVNKWLADNDKVQRKPFANLNVNLQRVIGTNKIAVKELKANKRTKSVKYSRKSNRQKHMKTFNSAIKGYSQDKLNNLSDNVFQNENINICDTVSYQPIVIDDSQDAFVVDKDKEAWLKVLEADTKEKEQLNKQKEDRDNSICEENEKGGVELLSSKFKVPFYKKDFLKDSCIFCNQSIHDTNVLNTTNKNEVTIVVTNTSFITTIKVSKESNSFSKSVGTNSVEVQTDSIQINPLSNNIHEISVKDNFLIPKEAKNNLDVNNKFGILSEDLFSEERPGATSNINKTKREAENDSNSTTNKRECLVIDESDDESDDSNMQWQHLEIKADIHRSCNEFDYGVLSEVRDEAAHGRRARRPARGLTPDSSDSSEKENFHPNKPKRAKRDDKKCTKK